MLLLNIILFSLIGNATAQTSALLGKEDLSNNIIIDADMPINLVLIGDTWSEEHKTQIGKKLLKSYAPTIFSENRPAGVRYNYTYNFISESQQVSDEFFKYVDSIAVKNSVPFPIEQWMVVQQPLLQSENLVYKLIDVFSVQDWLAELDRDDGYTIYFLKPSKEQLGYLHTYSALTTDPDTNRDFVQEGMMGFGGKHRFYFIDLTAGPWLYPFVPISATQAISEFHSNIYDIETDEEYYNLISNYVNDAIMLLFTPSYLYPPIYKSNYRMEVFLIDMTSGRAFRDLAGDYITSELMEQAFVKLVPYSHWTSDVKGQSFDALPRELQRAVLRSLTFQHTAGGDTILVKSSEFIVELKKWVKDSLTEEELKLEEEVTRDTVFVPIILFVFDTDAFVDKAPVVGTAIPDPENEKIPCCAVVAVDKHVLFDFGTGLSTLAIHEMGHVIGLRHPHDGYSQTKGEFNNWFFDWSYTPMSYASPTTLGCGLLAERCGLVITEFGTFNLDTVDRALVLSLLRQARLDLRDSVSELQEKGYEADNLPLNIQSKLSSIDDDIQRSKEFFTKMTYLNFTTLGTVNTFEIMDDAFDFAYRASINSQLFLEEIRDLPQSLPKPDVNGTYGLEVLESLFIDENGVESDIHEILEPVEIKSMVTNNLDRKINFTMIVQIKDEQEYTVSLTPLDVSVSSNEKAEPSLSWIFERPGEFSIEVFLWSGLEDPVPLSTFRSTSISLVR
jgi:hypothetical protein